MRRGILFASFFLAGAIIFFAGASFAVGATDIEDGTHIRTSEIWEKAKSPYYVKGRVYVEAELTIEPGTVIKLAYHKGELQLWSKINAVGTASEKIVFTSDRDDTRGGDTNRDGDDTEPAAGDWLNLNFGSVNSWGEMKHVSVLYAGYNSTGYPGSAVVINNNDDVSVANSEVLHTRGYAINVICASPTISENIISQNWYGILGSCDNEFPAPRNNSIFDNRYFGASVYIPEYHPPTGKMDMRDNWWGEASGPHYASRYGWPDNRGGLGDEISDGVLYDPWLILDPNVEKPPSDPDPDPAIIIPGIMGSWEKDGVWQIDPIFHTYDNLIEAFIAAGYENDGKKLSVFPYEWRDSNVDNAKLLHARIQQIKADTGRPKVDIVAHSMGGLLAREYIESDYYADDVDQLITLGTPHLGAPKDYVKWEAGAFFSDIFELAGKKFFEHEAEEEGYDSVFQYIRRRPMESVRELLPVYDYLWDDNGTGYDLRTGYPENYPRNEFLENLNDPENLKALENVEITNIVGKQNMNNTTISGFNVIDADMSNLWEHGYPHGFEMPSIGDQGIRKSDGDGTVPLESSENELILPKNTISFPSRHNLLPASSQKDVLEIISGERPLTEINNWVIDDILIGLVFSPVDVQIVSPNGKHLGKNFETGGEFNEIEGAFYTGYDSETEFLTIPNPEEGEYKIVIQGVDEGEYKIELVRISENPDDFDHAEISNAVISGEAQPEETEEAVFEIDEEEIIFDMTSLIAAIRRNIENYSRDSETLLNEEEFSYYKDRLDLMEKLCGKLFEERQSKKPIEKFQKEIHMHIDHLIRHIENNILVTIDEKKAGAVINYLNKIKNYNY